MEHPAIYPSRSANIRSHEDDPQSLPSRAAHSVVLNQGTMKMWPDTRVLNLFRIEVPIIQAPMAGANLSEMVVAVSEAGGLGSLPCALLSVEQARSELESIRRQTDVMNRVKK